jgi:cbb3-type cytochrome oxidase subunit 3
LGTDSAEHGATLARAVATSRDAETLLRRARRAFLAAWISVVVGGMGFGMLVVMVIVDEPANLGVAHGKSPEQLRAEALINLGSAIALLAMTILALLCLVVAIRYARKWARAASEAIATSDPENRRLFQRLRSSGARFALFLRGFQEEKRSFQTMFIVPVSTKRPDRATRWIESEIVDQLDRRGKKTFCIANPSDTFLLPGAVRLAARPDAWQSEVRALAKESDVIVIYLSSASQGLQTELDLLQTEKLTDRTIVVASKRAQARHRLLNDRFPLVIDPPPVFFMNQSAFGPLVGPDALSARFRFGYR